MLFQSKKGVQRHQRQGSGEGGQCRLETTSNHSVLSSPEANYELVVVRTETMSMEELVSRIQRKYVSP